MNRLGMALGAVALAGAVLGAQDALAAATGPLLRLQSLLAEAKPATLAELCSVPVRLGEQRELQLFCPERVVQLYSSADASGLDRQISPAFFSAFGEVLEVQPVLARGAILASLMPWQDNASAPQSLPLALRVMDSEGERLTMLAEHADGRLMSVDVYIQPGTGTYLVGLVRDRAVLGHGYERAVALDVTRRENEVARGTATDWQRRFICGTSDMLGYPSADPAKVVALFGRGGVLTESWRRSLGGLLCAQAGYDEKHSQAIVVGRDTPGLDGRVSKIITFDMYSGREKASFTNSGPVRSVWHVNSDNTLRRHDFSGFQGSGLGKDYVVFTGTSMDPSLLPPGADSVPVIGVLENNSLKLVSYHPVVSRELQAGEVVPWIAAMGGGSGTSISVAGLNIGGEKLVTVTLAGMLAMKPNVPLFAD